MNETVGPEGALERLTQVLVASEQPENEYRHELGAIREMRLGELVTFLADLASTSAAVPGYLFAEADSLATLIRDRPDSASEIELAVRNLSVGVATALSLQRARRPGGEQLDILERRAEVASTAAEAASSEIARLLDSARRLVGQYADDQLAAHYRSKADEEQRTANSWRRWTIVGFVGTLALSLTTTVLAVVADRGLEELVSTGGLSIALAGLTAYLASQARLHRDRETAYREAELKLAVIAPMIDSIDASARDAVRSEVVRLLFATQSRTAPP